MTKDAALPAAALPLSSLPPPLRIVLPLVAVLPATLVVVAAVLFAVLAAGELIDRLDSDGASEGASDAEVAGTIVSEEAFFNRLLSPFRSATAASCRCGL